MKNRLFSFFILLILFSSCQKEQSKLKKEATSIRDQVKVESPKKQMADATTILSRKEVPILCYHNIKNITASTSEFATVYTVTPAAFAEQMKILSDNGYHTILPNQLEDYLVYDKPLPSNPVMITFDDTREEQFSIGAAEMKKYGFKGVYFIMTVSINRPNYMTKEQIKNLSDNGHEVAAHTWDHHMVTKYEGADWGTQLVKPKKKLEDIIGKPVNYFAYPFGLWNHSVIPEVKNSGYKLAFILSTKRDSLEPLHTVRRIIVSGFWSAPTMLKEMKSSFK
ncbi:polysaccharide deacetylase family protein [Flavobacterium psychrotolerans]|uniref:Polysaccharide deacetylase n=1 Tax=Flavobacterium psychrotolerans TaxID=2169410 RepID=A0A2U1JJY1_9FLAO|nr:polysaccharide deacetylase family protein [Flavobacterium psychrotolerans]PWA05188.1 polysaccharide deacetylase [Flavobacterium psychrotolerans]